LAISVPTELIYQDPLAIDYNLHCSYNFLKYLGIISKLQDTAVAIFIQIVDKYQEQQMS